ncbi:uncharacterized protein MICPUCDRAFT_58310 [Micromonas pusilla CCMP1545]|jgi:hypothetical protein|uniref:Predicted protein n=1 Tax=Micromonas pusilla (strain CCMP1545) TaxID=564608 RepID=C1MS17_MICPC|nr:uncharacterized protein MICPUCDRAFT_58310 [Micromonas pusilla CCMP1545]EEH57062.1 predicted protein [Micromonas pusilla CCMP1545]|eukprot:XP_003058607.1 predicted protein [Micromonas pusilla CCMP1545]
MALTMASTPIRVPAAAAASARAPRVVARVARATTRLARPTMTSPARTATSRRDATTIVPRSVKQDENLAADLEALRAKSVDVLAEAAALERQIAGGEVVSESTIVKRAARSEAAKEASGMPALGLPSASTINPSAAASKKAAAPAPAPTPTPTPIAAKPAPAPAPAPAASNKPLGMTKAEAVEEAKKAKSSRTAPPAATPAPKPPPKKTAGSNVGADLGAVGGGVLVAAALLNAVQTFPATARDPAFAIVGAAAALAIVKLTQVVFGAVGDTPAGLEPAGGKAKAAPMPKQKPKPKAAAAAAAAAEATATVPSTQASLEESEAAEEAAVAANEETEEKLREMKKRAAELLESKTDEPISEKAADAATLTRDAVNAFYADGPGADGVTMSEADVVKTAPADAAAAAAAAEKKKDDGPRESSFLEKLFAVIAVPFKILFALIMWLPSKLFRSSSD